MDKQIIIFSKRFNELIKVLKSTIENFFLDSHKSIQLTIQNNEIVYFVNMGRYVLQGKEVPDSIEGFKEKVVKSFEIELLKNYIESDPDKKLKLVFKNDRVFVYNSGFQFPLKESESPEEIELPFVDKKPLTHDNNELFKNLFSSLLQKENLITIKDSQIYEKLSEYLYHLEKREELGNFNSISFAYKDLKLVTTLVGKEDLSFNIAPTYNLFATQDVDIWVMKYNLDAMDKEPLQRREKLSTSSVMNCLDVNLNELQKVVKILNLNGVKQFNFSIGNEFCIGSENTGYKIKSESKISKATQKFIINKKEIDIILKDSTYKDRLRIVSGKDFAIINNRFLLMMKGLNND